MLGSTRSVPAGAGAGGSAARPRVEIFLVHGYTGFLPAVPTLYWARFAPIRRCLERLAAAVVITRQPAAGSVEQRAAALADAVAASQADRIVLVGHSMGGLDARMVASRMDDRRRVSHVVTIGTPHQGTPAASAALRLGRLPARFCRWVDEGALEALTPAHAGDFNATCPDREDVSYTAIVGRRDVDYFHPAWQRNARFLQRRCGANDGLVATRSAAWSGRNLFVRADHLELIGHAPLPGGLPLGSWPRHFVPLRRLFRHLVAEAAAGLVAPSRS